MMLGAPLHCDKIISALQKLRTPEPRPSTITGCPASTNSLTPVPTLALILSWTSTLPEALPAANVPNIDAELIGVAFATEAEALIRVFRLTLIKILLRFVGSHRCGNSYDA